ncbi:MAG: ATP-binding protein [Polyangiaceae bacterium]
MSSSALVSPQDATQRTGDGLFEPELDAEVSARERLAKAFATLRESEERFRELAATVQEVFWISDPAQRRMLYISPGYEKIWGRSCESLLRDPQGWMEAVHPDDRDRVRAAWTGLPSDGRFLEEYRVIRPDGTVRWVRAEARPIVTGADHVARVAGVARDVTERRVAQEEMRAANARYARQEAALAAVTRACAVREVDTSQLLAEVSRVAATTLEVERLSVWRLSQDRRRIVCVSLFARSGGAHEAGTVVETARFPEYMRALAIGEIIAAPDVHADPRTRDLAEFVRPFGISSVLDAPLLATGSVIGAVCAEHVGQQRAWTPDEQTFLLAISNLVSLVLAEEERLAVEGQLRQSQKMEAIGQLAGGVAHDFNNILTSMIMQVELIGMLDVSDEVRDGLAEIDAAAQRAANLTKQLLLFGRRQTMAPRDLDLNDVVTNVAKMLLRIIGEDIRLQLHLHPAPLLTRADAGMLDQVLLNLSVNARDAMPDGGRLTIETHEVLVDDEAARREPDLPPGRYVGIKVSDTGSGIPAEVLPRIFEPFFTTKERGKGTGLGLATVFGIVKQHRGAARVTSELGAGTTFHVLLPARERAIPEPAGPDRPPRSRSGDGETILLAEDEPAVRALTRAALERHGYRVMEAGTGADALLLWRDARDVIALLVTDLVMPGGVNGQELARAVRAERPSIPIVFISGYSLDVAGKELRLDPGTSFLQKPFGPAVLLDAVSRALDA